MYSTKQVKPTSAMGRNQSGATFNAREKTVFTSAPITTTKRAEDMISPFQHKKTPVVMGAINN